MLHFSRFILILGYGAQAGGYGGQVNKGNVILDKMV